LAAGEIASIQLNDIKLHNVKTELDDKDAAFQNLRQHLRESLSPRPLIRNFIMADQSGRYHFPLRVSLNYQLTDAERALEQAPDEVEARLIRALTPLLQQESQQHPLDKYEQLEARLTAAIDEQLFRLPGLKLLKHDVLVQRDDEDFQADLKRLEVLRRLRNTPQYQRHECKLPSSHLFYKFEATVDVTYVLEDPDRLPTDDLPAVEARLWPRVSAEIAKISARIRQWPAL
jgi:hypothetical protein